MEECPDRKILGERIQKLRKGAGYKSAKAFAEKAGVSQNAYVECEQGRSRLSYENAWRIADVLGVSLDELGGRDWPSAGAAPSAPDEGELLGLYRTCTPDRQRRTLDDLRDRAAVSGEAEPDAPLAEVREVTREAV